MKKPFATGAAMLVRMAGIAMEKNDRASPAMAAQFGLTRRR
jgi:hypothetical protein